MSAARSSTGVRWNVVGRAFTPSVLEWEPTSLMIDARSASGSRCSLLGTVREWAEATNNTGSPVPAVAVADWSLSSVAVDSSVDVPSLSPGDRSTNTWSTSQSCQWKFVENWSNAE